MLQTLGMGELHLDDTEFMASPRTTVEVEIPLHKVDGDLDLLKMVKVRPKPNPAFLNHTHPFFTLICGLNVPSYVKARLKC